MACCATWLCTATWLYWTSKVCVHGRDECHHYMLAASFVSGLFFSRTMESFSTSPILYSHPLFPSPPWIHVLKSELFTMFTFKPNLLLCTRAALGMKSHHLSYRIKFFSQTVSCCTRLCSLTWALYLYAYGPDVNGITSVNSDLLLLYTV